jgi:hypothetical protein
VLNARDQTIVLERDRGDTTVEVGRRFAISPQRVSAVTANATKFVDAVDLDLLASIRQ